MFIEKFPEETELEYRMTGNYASFWFENPQTVGYVSSVWDDGIEVTEADTFRYRGNYYLRIQLDVNHGITYDSIHTSMVGIDPNDFYQIRMNGGKTLVRQSNGGYFLRDDTHPFVVNTLKKMRKNYP